MKYTPPHLKTLEEIEQECIPGLVEVLHWEGIEAVRYALFDMTNWHRDYAPCIVAGWLPVGSVLVTTMG